MTSSSFSTSIAFYVQLQQKIISILTDHNGSNSFQLHEALSRSAKQLFMNLEAINLRGHGEEFEAHNRQHDHNA